MIYAAQLYKLALKANKFGINVEKVTPDFNKVIDYTEKLVNDAIKSNENQIEK